MVKTPFFKLIIYIFIILGLAMFLTLVKVIFLSKFSLSLLGIILYQRKKKVNRYSLNLPSNSGEFDKAGCVIAVAGCG
jgi:predicted membrane protein